MGPRSEERGEGGGEIGEDRRIGASMGPRSEERGESENSVVPLVPELGFNGAALRGARRGRASCSDGLSGRSFNGAALRGARRGRAADLSGYR
mgnify:CR=1 FL=1